MKKIIKRDAVCKTHSIPAQKKAAGIGAASSPCHCYFNKFSSAAGQGAEKNSAGMDCMVFLSLQCLNYLKLITIKISRKSMYYYQDLRLPGQ